MKRLLRSALSNLSHQVIQRSNGRHPGVRILTYHRVTDAHPGDRLCVPVSKFAEQMRYLRENGYQAVTLKQVLQWMKSRSAFPHRPVVVTFDDGFEDNFIYAAPVLQLNRLTACFFIPTQFIEAGPVGCRPEDRPMSWEQLRQLLEVGFDIGGHSVTHRKLTTIDPTELFEEIKECKEMLERRLDGPINFFCYPSGDYDERVKAVVKTSGYLGACTVRPGETRPGVDPFALMRTEVSAFDSIWDFEKKLVGAYDWLHAAVQYVGRMGKAQVVASAVE